MDLADHAGADQLDDAAAVVAGVALVAHLGDQLGIGLGQLGQLAALLDRVGKRLLHEDVQAALHGLTGGDGVVVVGRSDQDRVDILPRVQHLAVVAEAFGLVVGVLKRLLLRLDGAGLVDHRGVHVVVVDVGRGHDVLAGQLGHVGRALPARADHRDVDLVAGLQGPRRAQRRSGQGGRRSAGQYGAPAEALGSEVTCEGLVRSHVPPRSVWIGRHLA